MILGPSGTGKTRLAQLFHKRSGRPGNYVEINCSAYPTDLLEAELFGHKRGAFTGAFDSRKGKLLEADEGTLFLDEIGSMSLEMQTKLLKAIEEKRFHPVGSERREESHFRVVSATLEPIQELVTEKRLRFDFYSRISGIDITLKPLAARISDIYPLIRHFTHGRKRLAFTPESRDYLRSYSWPGNIRELKKLVDLLVEGTTGRIDLAQIRSCQSRLAVSPSADQLLSHEVFQHALKEGLHSTLDSLRRAIVKRQLQVNNGNKTRTMKDLKIASKTLYAALGDGESNGN